MLLSEVAKIIGSTYGLNDVIISRLVFTYETYVGQNGNTNTKTVYIEEQDDLFIGNRSRRNDPNIAAPIPITIDDLTMKVRVRIGDLIESDDTCDSEFMDAAMNRVAEAIRAAYEWVWPTEPIYLVMDNAGGHGTNEAVKKYKDRLKYRYNIIIIH